MSHNLILKYSSGYTKPAQPREGVSTKSNNSNRSRSRYAAAGIRTRLETKSERRRHSSSTASNADNGSLQRSSSSAAGDSGRRRASTSSKKKQSKPRTVATSRRPASSHSSSANRAGLLGVNHHHRHHQHRVATRLKPESPRGRPRSRSVANAATSSTRLSSKKVQSLVARLSNPRSSNRVRTQRKQAAASEKAFEEGNAVHAAKAKSARGQGHGRRRAQSAVVRRPRSPPRQALKLGGSSFGAVVGVPGEPAPDSADSMFVADANRLCVDPTTKKAIWQMGSQHRAGLAQTREDIDAAREELKVAWAKANLFLTQRSLAGARRALSSGLLRPASAASVDRRSSNQSRTGSSDIPSFLESNARASSIDAPGNVAASGTHRPRLGSAPSCRGVPVGVSGVAGDGLVGGFSVSSSLGLTRVSPRNINPQIHHQQLQGTWEQCSDDDFE